MIASKVSAATAPVETAGPIDLTIVTPTRGGVEQVRALLASLASAIGLARDTGFQCEVIVVDDSRPDEAAEIQLACNAHGVRYLAGPRHVGAKRNLGAARAMGSIVLFVDSDCRPTEQLLVEHIDAHGSSNSTVAGVAGVTVFEQGRRGRPSVGSLSQVYEAFGAARHSSSLAWATTSNLSFEKSFFLELGGFDEKSWTHVGGEDVDLGLRSTAKGRSILGRPDAVVHHAAPRGVMRSARKLFTYGQADNWLCERFPQHEKPHLNPVGVAVACVLLAGVMRRPRLWSVLAAGVLVADAVGEARRRAVVNPDTPTMTLVGASALDWAYDLGVLVGAVRRGRIRSVFTEFRY